MEVFDSGQEEDIENRKQTKENDEIGYCAWIGKLQISDIEPKERTDEEYDKKDPEEDEGLQSVHEGM
jgi:hypothetical protein